MRRNSQIAALAALLSCSIAFAVNVRSTLGLNPDGVRSTAFPCVLTDRSDCAPPTAATLACDDSAAQSLVGLLTGNAYSADVRQYFSGTDAATATLSVVSVSGDDATSEGWAIASAGAGDNLTHGGSGTGAGALKIRGTASGDSVDCAVRLWSYIDAPAADTTAPTIPAGLTFEAGTNQVTFRWKASMDPYDGETCSGVDEYDLDIAGSVVQVAGQAGLCPQLTQSIIGAADGTPDSIQDGIDWDLSFGGDGLDDATDHILFRGASVTDNFKVRAKVSALASSAEFEKAGLMWRESSAVGARHCSIWYQGNGRVQGKCRTTPDTAVTSNLFTLPASLAQCLEIERASNTTTLRTSADADCAALTDQASISNPAAAEVIAGMFITSNAAGTNATATVERFALSASPDLAYVHNTTTAKTGRVRARDVEGNNSAYTATITATPNASSAPQKKWHPGHYMQIQRGEGDTNQSTRLGYYNQIANSTTIEGVSVPLRWARLETTEGNYASGMTEFAAEIAHLKGLSVPKRLLVRINDHNFGGSCPSTSHIPAYVSAQGYTFQTNNGCNWKRYNATAMTSYINMLRAYCEAFDDEPYFEGFIVLRESPLSFGGSTPPADYSIEAYTTQYNRLMAEIVAACPKSLVISPISFLGTQSNVNAHIAYVHSIGGGAGNMDTCPSGCSMQSDLTLRGASGGVDYRGGMPIVYSVEASVLGNDAVGPDGGFTPTQIGDFANDTMRINHLMWDRNMAVGTSAQRWDTGILPYINANPLEHSACPSAFAQGCEEE